AVADVPGLEGGVSGAEPAHPVAVVEGEVDVPVGEDGRAGAAAVVVGPDLVARAARVVSAVDAVVHQVLEDVLAVLVAGVALSDDLAGIDAGAGGGADGDLVGGEVVAVEPVEIVVAPAGRGDEGPLGVVHRVER